MVLILLQLEWGKMLRDLRQGYMDCLNGDCESASSYLQIAAGDIDAAEVVVAMLGEL